MHDNDTTNTLTVPVPLPVPVPPSVRRKKTVKKIVISLVVAIGFLVLLPFIVFIGGIAYFQGSYSAAPSINVDGEKAYIRKLLHSKYGKAFTVIEVTTKGRRYLGDSQSISAKAHPDDDENAKITLHKTLGFDKEYSDNYLSHVWSTQARALLAEKVNEIYEVPPEFKSGISPNSGFASEYRLGRVMSLDEAVREIPDKINYQMEIIAGATGTKEEHSSKLYRLKEYMDSRYKGTRSHIWYDFTSGEELYRCFLPGFRLQFIESDRQVYGCWYPTRNTIQPTYDFRETIQEVEGESLPIIIRPSGSTITTLNNTDSSSYPKSYTVKNAGLTAQIDIYDQGLGDRINESKKQFIMDWTNSIPADNDTTTILLEPDQSVTVGAITYRRDMNPSKRTIHYVLAYKTFLVHVHATTHDTVSGVDVRDQEFWLYNFVGNMKPVDGFKET